MLVSETATVIWNSRNKKHYVDRGYEFTKMRDPVEVCIDDLTVGSQAIVTFKCDYCGELFSRPWHAHIGLSRRGFEDTDCCGNNVCIQKKAKECVSAKFGGYAEMKYATDDKRILTNIDRYGCANPFGNEDVKLKIIQSNLEKYGVPHSQQSSEVRDKTVKTCRKKYGVDNYVELFKGKYIKENSPNWKGGVAYSRVERATYEYRQWRNSVFARDGYRCCKCGKCGAKSGETGSNVELNAHRIHNWNDNPDLQYDVSNGVTLCDLCHLEFHSKFGKRNNTNFQLEEFLFSDKKIC